MAIVQTAKNLASMRGRYQTAEVRRWLEGHPPAVDDKSRIVAWPDRAFDDLTALLGVATASDDLLRLFDQPIELVAAQISAVAELALAEPGSHLNLLVAIGGIDVVPDINTLASSRGSGMTSARASIAASAISQRIQTGIDVLQTSIGQRWRRHVRLVASLVAGGIALVPAALAPPTHTKTIFVLAALVLGGFFSWLFRDLVAIVERLRS